MNLRVIGAEPLPDYQLELGFGYQERNVFDVKPYLNVGVFEVLQDAFLFGRVKPFNSTVVWPNDLNLVRYGPWTTNLSADSRRRTE